MKAQFCGLLLMVAACTRQPADVPLHYPPLPPAPSASTEPAAFDPAPSLVALTLACRAAELPLANALDDDCNGQIDDAPVDDPLLLALAYPSGVAVKLAVRADEHTEVELVPTDCDDIGTFCTLRLSTARLARGRHALLVHQNGAGASSAPPSVVVSVQSRGKVTTYLARLDPSQREQPLGELALP